MLTECFDRNRSWAGGCWAGLGWAGLGWAGLGWVGWAGWAAVARFFQKGLGFSFSFSIRVYEFACFLLKRV